MEDYDWEIPRGELYFSGIQITENGVLVAKTERYFDELYENENGMTITVPVNVSDNSVCVDRLAMEALMDLAGFKKVDKK